MPATVTKRKQANNKAINPTNKFPNAPLTSFCVTSFSHRVKANSFDNYITCRCNK